MRITERRVHRILIVMLLLLSALACRPVITVGYSEVLIVLVIGLVLLGPLIFRIYRFMERLQGAPRDEKKPEQPKNSKRQKDSRRT